MRIRYIYNYILEQLLLVVAVAVLFMATTSACSDDFPGGKGTCPEGEPAMLTLDLNLGLRNVYSRGELRPNQENEIMNLWVAVYNVGSGRRTGLVKLDDLGSHNIHEYKKLTIPTFSGESYVVAVANYSYRKAKTSPESKVISLPEALDAADTWSKFCDISVFFDEKGSSFTEAPANSLVMTGYYTTDDETHKGRPAMSTLTIQPGPSSPEGSIHLRRMISQVKFNVKYNTQQIKSFSVDYWSVNNMPSNAWLHERGPVDAAIKSEQTNINSFDSHKVAGTLGYNNTGNYTTLTEKDGTYSFDFWMLENKRTGRITDAEKQAAGGTDAAAYRLREREYKNDDGPDGTAGTNTGKYMSLVDSKESTDPNNNATFVTFHVSMEMTVDENGHKLTGNDRRFVQANYVVHLGYINKDVNDFSCLRNSKYIYNITINNVNDLVVDAVNNGENPAVDGDITDITDSFYYLDAHYCVMNVYLDASDLNNFQYYVTATRLNGSEITIDSQVASSVPKSADDDYIYLSWIELSKTPTTGNTINAYKPDETHTLPEFKEQADGGKLKAGYYTVYVNEYVYETTTAAKEGNESNSTNWKNYVNRPARRMWLLVQRGISYDTESKHFHSKMALAQQSIQCYYDVNHTGLTSAIGIEHTNETLGLALRNTFNKSSNGAGTNDKAGRYNLAQYITGATGANSLTWKPDYNTYSGSGGNRRYYYRWATYLNLTEQQTVPAINKQGLVMDARTEAMPLNITGSSGYITLTDGDKTSGEASITTIQSISACLSRNRDLNGDGVIDANELRWFVPTSSQYVRMILGRQALQDPLLDPKGLTKLENENNRHNTRFLFYASDAKFLWAMEGTSLGLYNNNGSTPWEIRCARNLGSNMTVINSTAANEPAISVDKTNRIVDMSRYAGACLRSEAFIDRPIPIHHVNDQHYNRSYRAFQYKNEVVRLTDERLSKNENLAIKTGESWSTYITRVNPCDIYNTGTERGWRLPNQKEMAILGILDNYDSNTVTYHVGCTFSYFDVNGYIPGSNPNNKSGAITSEYHHEMKINEDTGGGTQYGFMKSYQGDNIFSGMEDGSTMYTNGFRCVRDYTGSL